MLIEQLKLSKTIPYTVQADGQETFTVSSSQNSYSVTNENQSCNCSFHKIMAMPCRHIFFARQHLGMSDFEISMVAINGKNHTRHY